MLVARTRGQRHDFYTRRCYLGLRVAVDVPPESKVAGFREAIIAWATDGNLRDFPWRADVSPFEVLVAEILLQQTFADKVEPVYDALIAEYPTPTALGAASEDEIVAVIESLGFQNQRATALMENGRRIADNGLPTTVNGLKELSYVGDYAANATLCFGFDERRPIVDTNVERVYERAFDVTLDANDPESWAFAESLLPEDDYRAYNLALLDIGALICTPADPACGRCPVAEHCAYV